MAAKKDEKKDEKKGKPMPPWVKGKKEDPKKAPAKKASASKKSLTPAEQAAADAAAEAAFEERRNERRTKADVPPPGDTKAERAPGAGMKAPAAAQAPPEPDPEPPAVEPEPEPEAKAPKRLTIEEERRLLNRGIHITRQASRKREEASVFIARRTQVYQRLREGGVPGDVIADAWDISRQALDKAARGD